MLTVACVLKSGGVYDAEWVRKLRDGVFRNLSLPHRFACLSDVEVPCERIPLKHGWKGWWSKLELFDAFKGPTLYFDLDTVVVGSLDKIGAHAHTFTMTHEFYRPRLMCSTAMAWNGDYSFIPEAFAENPETFSKRYDLDLMRKESRVGDQAFIEDHLKAAGVKVETFRDLFGEYSIASYKVHNCQNEIPADAAVVAFHGIPKPHELRNGWVAKTWI